MKVVGLVFAFLICVSVLKAQTLSAEYFLFIHQADSLYQAKQYKASGLAFAAAFKCSNNLGESNDRYDAACSWALAGYPDSAFNNLNYLVVNENYSSYQHVTKDTDLTSLHQHKRWLPLIQQVKQNQIKAEAKYNKLLVKELNAMFVDDQSERIKFESLVEKYGRNSKEVSALLAVMTQKDEVNLVKVKAILDKYGWLGPEIVSPQGSTALFLVIQHADQKSRKKYLPMMREAVKQGKANAYNLALMEDRVALEQGKKQIYGSQIGRDVKTGKYYVRPIEDEQNVNKRRASVGLEPLEIYCKNWGINYKLPQVTL